MNSQEKNIRNFVKNLLKENYQEIDEANKGKQFNSYFELVFKNIKPNIPENKFSDIEILQKAKELINNKLTKVFLKDFEVHFSKTIMHYLKKQKNSLKIEI